eukprot:scaffold16092_cov127-Isochrysis_galbana.AAC.2
MRFSARRPQSSLGSCRSFTPREQHHLAPSAQPVALDVRAQERQHGWVIIRQHDTVCTEPSGKHATNTSTRTELAHLIPCGIATEEGGCVRLQIITQHVSCRLPDQAQPGMVFAIFMPPSAVSARLMRRHCKQQLQSSLLDQHRPTEPHNRQGSYRRVCPQGLSATACLRVFTDRFTVTYQE